MKALIITLLTALLTSTTLASVDRLPTHTIMSLVILSESRGEGRVGMKLTMLSIVNRANRFKDRVINADHVRRVCLRPYQFEGLSKVTTKIDQILKSKEANFAMSLSVSICNGLPVDVSDVPKHLRTVTHFHNASMIPWWTKSEKMKFLGVYRGHFYYQEIV